MQAKKYFVRLTLIVIGAIFSAAIGEAIFRSLPVTMGLYRTKNHETWPMHGYDVDQTFAYSFGWQLLSPNRGRTNNYGQHSAFNFQVDSKPVLVIGDSFVEAQMIPFENTLQGNLTKLMSDLVPVYGFGFAGNSLAEYLSIAKMTRTEFSPVALIFVITHNDIKESWSNRLGHRYFEINEDKVREGYQALDQVSMLQKFRTTFGESALYRYIQINLGFTIDRVFHKHRSEVSGPRQETGVNEGRSRLAVDYFLSQLPLASGVQPGNIWFVVDADRERIYNSSKPPYRGVDSTEIATYFQSQARQNGFRVFETKAYFQRHFAQHKRRFDFTPIDRHWNALGHAVVAEGVFNELLQALCKTDTRLTFDLICGSDSTSGNQLPVAR